ncbi:hypothetical protein [Coprococcus sp. AF21-14LB]|nr:hypothetical protein [Coprococcus sp. AF21-14LB]
MEERQEHKKRAHVTKDIVDFVDEKIIPSENWQMKNRLCAGFSEI